MNPYGMCFYLKPFLVDFALVGFTQIIQALSVHYVASDTLRMLF